MIETIEHIELTSDKVKLNNLANALCDDCLSILISVSSKKNMSEGLAYLVIVSSVCDVCYDKLVEKKLVSQVTNSIGSAISTQVDGLWLNTVQLIKED